jgi:lipopolysaccharide export system permease protein
MLFSKAFHRELASTAGFVFVILFTIYLTNTLIKILGRAANGRVDTASVLPNLAFTAVNVLPSILTVAIFIAVLATLSRAHRDSEMVVWFASGQSQFAWVRPVITFALPIILVIAALSFFLTPWANQQISASKKRFEQREDVSQVVAGQFRESAANNRVFFVESLTKDFTEVRNIFVLQQRPENQTIVVAANGFIRDDGKDRFLVLEKGRRYDQAKTSSELQLLEFETHGIRLESKAIDFSDEAAKVKTTSALIKEPSKTNFAELHRRIGVPITALVLSLLAIPLAYVNPRVGRSVNIIAAILIYFIYNQLLDYFQTLIGLGKVNFGLGVVVVHVIFIVVLILLFVKRLSLGGIRGAFMRFIRRVFRIQPPTKLGPPTDSTGASTQ